MADPRLEVVTPDQRDAKLSKLMKAKSKAKTNEKINFCPHGCELVDLDNNGYCRHLVGFTVYGKLMEPMILERDKDGHPTGRRVVQVKKKRNGAGVWVPVYEPVLKTDILVRITTSYRVYRENVPLELTEDELLERQIADEEAEKEKNLATADMP